MPAFRGHGQSKPLLESWQLFISRLFSWLLSSLLSWRPSSSLSLQPSSWYPSSPPSLLLSSFQFFWLPYGISILPSKQIGTALFYYSGNSSFTARKILTTVRESGTAARAHTAFASRRRAPDGWAFCSLLLFNGASIARVYWVPLLCCLGRGSFESNLIRVPKLLRYLVQRLATRRCSASIWLREGEAYRAAPRSRALADTERRSTADAGDPPA
jgi:hypothetical protein